MACRSFTWAGVRRAGEGAGRRDREALARLVAGRGSRDGQAARRGRCRSDQGRRAPRRSALVPAGRARLRSRCGAAGRRSLRGERDRPGRLAARARRPRRRARCGCGDGERLRAGPRFAPRAARGGARRADLRPPRRRGALGQEPHHRRCPGRDRGAHAGFAAQTSSRSARSPEPSTTPRRKCAHRSSRVTVSPVRRGAASRCSAEASGPTTPRSK